MHIPERSYISMVAFVGLSAPPTRRLQADGAITPFYNAPSVNVPISKMNYLLCMMANYILGLGRIDESIRHAYSGMQISLSAEISDCNCRFKALTQPFLCMTFFQSVYALSAKCVSQQNASFTSELLNYHSQLLHIPRTPTPLFCSPEISCTTPNGC